MALTIHEYGSGGTRNSVSVFGDVDAFHYARFNVDAFCEPAIYILSSIPTHPLIAHNYIRVLIFAVWDL